MWTTNRTLDRTTQRTLIASEGRVLSFGEVIAGWRDDESFRAFFIGELAAAPFAAFFWETPPVRRGQLNIAYEHVAVRGDPLARMRPDPDAFASAFDKSSASASVATFPNLGGDAVLIAPKPIAGFECYTNRRKC